MHVGRLISAEYVLTASGSVAFPIHITCSASNVQNDRTRVWHLNFHNPLLVRRHRLPDRHVGQPDGLTAVQLIVIRPAIPRDPRDGIAPVREQPLHGKRLRRRHLERVLRGRTLRVGIRVRVVVLDHIDDRDPGQLVIDVCRVCGLCLLGQRQVHDADVVPAADHFRDEDVAVVRGLGAQGGLVRLHGLPRRVPVVGALVHVCPADALRGGVEVEVNAPEGGAEGVGETRAALVVQRVVLAEDVGDSRGQVLGREGAGEGDVFGYAVDSVGVVHQGVLQGYSGLGRAANVTGKRFHQLWV